MHIIGNILRKTRKYCEYSRCSNAIRQKLNVNIWKAINDFAQNFRKFSPLHHKISIKNYVKGCKVLKNVI